MFVQHVFNKKRKEKENFLKSLHRSYNHKEAKETGKKMSNKAHEINIAPSHIMALWYDGTIVRLRDCMVG